MAPESFTTFAHFAVSAAMCFAKSSGVPPAAFAPCFGELLLRLRRREPLRDLRVELRDDRRRRAGRREDAEPRRRLEARKTGFRNRRHVRQRGRTRERRDGERAHLARLDLRQRRRQVVEHQLHLPAKEILQGRSAALVRDVGHLHAGHHLEELAGQVDRRSVARRCEVELAGICLRIGDELGHRVRGHRRIDDQHVRNARDEDHRREILHVVVRHLGVEAGVDRVRADRSHLERVAVGRGMGDELRADVAARTGSVVDDDLLAPGLGQLLRDVARQDVGRATGRKRDDDADRFHRVRLGGGPRGDEREGCAEGKAAEQGRHGDLLFNRPSRRRPSRCARTWRARRQ